MSDSKPGSETRGNAGPEPGTEAGACPVTGQPPAGQSLHEALERPPVTDWRTDWDHLDPQWRDNPFPIWDE
ncbi:MAG: hypothetical protein OXH64_04545, partial [Rhodospirillaceae bacterium]|nr:hypothetical protein [Rhodospirillaceae bacterium]